MSGAPLIESGAAHDDGVYSEGREGHDTHGHIKSYVRRAGRMSEAQHRYFDEMMPQIGVAYQPSHIDLNALFGRDNPKILEIGCGMGETTARSGP